MCVTTKAQQGKVAQPRRRGCTCLSLALFLFLHSPSLLSPSLSLCRYERLTADAPSAAAVPLHSNALLSTAALFSCGSQPLLCPSPFYLSLSLFSRLSFSLSLSRSGRGDCACESNPARALCVPLLSGCRSLQRSSLGRAIAQLWPCVLLPPSAPCASFAGRFRRLSVLHCTLSSACEGGSEGARGGWPRPRSSMCCGRSTASCSSGGRPGSAKSTVSSWWGERRSKESGGVRERREERGGKGLKGERGKRRGLRGRSRQRQRDRDREMACMCACVCLCVRERGDGLHSLG